MKMFIVIVCIVIVMTVMAASILFDSVEVKEEESVTNEETDSEEKDFEPIPKPVHKDIIHMSDIDAKVNWAKQRAKAHSQTPSNNTDEDSRQSRMEGRDYPHSYYEER